MGLKGEVSAVTLNRQHVAIRVPAAYGVGAGQTIFTIQGGPVLIVALFGVIVTAPFGAGGTTLRYLVSGVAVDTAVAVSAAVNSLIISPLDDTGVSPVVVGAVSDQPLDKMLAGPGTIQITTLVAATVGTVGFYCVYRKLDPASQII